MLDTLLRGGGVLCYCLQGLTSAFSDEVASADA